LTFNYTESEGWENVGNCGIRWKTRLNDSRDYQQEINFHHNIVVEFRSANDPHIKFGLRTDGSFMLD
jgi:Tfp pilus assembly protein PilF